VILTTTDVVTITTSTSSPLDVYFVIKGSNTKRYLTSISSATSTNLPSPVSNQSNLTDLIIHNKHASVANTVTISFNSTVLWSGDLEASASIVYEEFRGFVVI
jgi:hypothetical protein